MALRALQGPTGGGSPVGGGGTSSPSTIPRWTGPSTLGDSVITQSGAFIGIGLGAAAPLATVHTLNAVGAIGASPNWMSSFDASGNYRSGLAFAFSVTPAASKVAVQVSSNGTGGVVNAIVAQGDGNVGIGTASPTGRLHVVGGTAAASTNGAPVTIIAQSGGTGNTNGGSIVLTPGTQSGTGTVGLVDLSGPTGTGLKLPATPGNADTQTLDCYAEVAWTPADVSGAGLTITVNRATYTKIGRTVTASFDISYPVTANGTAAQISLPESTSTANLGTLAAPYCSTAAAGLTGIVTNGRIVFYYGAPSANVPNSVFSGARIVASVTFTV